MQCLADPCMVFDETMATGGADDEWEFNKENVQPLRQGRRFANLSAALNSSLASLKHEQEYVLSLACF